MCLKSLTRVSVIYGCITNDPKIKWFRATRASYLTASVGQESKGGLTLVLAQGLLGGCSPDVGLGFPGAEDLWDGSLWWLLARGDTNGAWIWRESLPSQRDSLQSLSRANMGFSMGVSWSRGEQGKCRQPWEGRWNEFRLNHPEEHCYWVSVFWGTKRSHLEDCAHTPVQEVWQSEGKDVG